MFKGLTKGLQKGLLIGHNKGLLTGNKKGLVSKSAPPSQALGFDVDAWAYIQALQAQKVTIPNEWMIAINTFVKSGKAHGWWDAADCIYPIIGGTANSHAINLKNPNRFSVTWHGTLSHTAIGVQSTGGSGSNDYGDTGYNPAVGGFNLNNSGGCIAMYISGAASTGFTAPLGNLTSITTQLTTIRTQFAGYEGFIAENASTLNSAFPTDHIIQGFFSFLAGGPLGATTARNFNNGYANSILYSGFGLFNGNMWIVNANFGNSGLTFNPSTQIFSFFYFGGNTFKDVDLWNDVENLQVVLGRGQLGGS